MKSASPSTAPVPVVNETITVMPGDDETSDVFFLVSVVAPLLFCCFAIFVCALNSIWMTRSKLQALTLIAKQREPTEYTEFTIDLTTKVDSCVELSSPQISSKEESVLL
ncbi:unnamed protein product [Caenorhabditis bovis]|uniref:Uncharacterized protein n=1 Tax=Caenorhabditis bovis TaxID=2654633 RepID=A0A8S1EKF0_9PELO|nr:unnamed protein product [Caenorhabditis bovis]